MNSIENKPKFLHAGKNSLIYIGNDSDIEKTTILKTVNSDYPSPHQKIKYTNEYQILKKINIYGVRKAYKLETVNDKPILHLEYIKGENLKSSLDYLMRDDFIAFLKDFLKIAINISGVLGEIHKNNIIHNGINSFNILIDLNSLDIKLIDFSLAASVNIKPGYSVNPLRIEGNLHYISPEQSGRMNRTVDYRTDLYSLGVTLYELLCKKLPFESKDPMEIIHAHIAKIPVSPSNLNPEIPEVLSTIILKLLAKNAEDRYQSAFGLKTDLEKCLKQLNDKAIIEEFKILQSDFSGKFHIAQKLYGRQEEINQLIDAFKRIDKEKSEMVLVEGYSGVGKSALVHEVHKHIIEKRGIFIEGKFEQFQQNIPYYAIKQALLAFTKQIIPLNKDDIEKWKRKILDALGHNAGLISGLIPELEFIIGKQPKVKDVGSQEAQNRFNFVFHSLINAIGTKEHPLVLFIDDLQWADQASLKLLEALMTDTHNHHFLLILSYRDNEVSDAHPLSHTISEINEKGNAYINRIHLGNLTIKDVNNLLVDALNCNLEFAKPLTDLIFKKTLGNAFFTTQFIKSLYEEKDLRYDFEHGNWNWNIEKIKARNITDNVVELMASRITKLPKKSQEVLKLAASIGNKFELNNLSVIYEKNRSKTLDHLWAGVEEGLILPLDNNFKLISESEKLKVLSESNFKFLHDRVQQATYSLIPEKSKKEIHLKIGHLLLENSSKSDLKSNLFDIVDQLNKAQNLINDPNEKMKLAKLNLRAGKQAKKAAAYESVLKYIKKGIEYLPYNSWDSHYVDTYDLFKAKAEAEFLNNNFKKSESIIDLLLNKSKTEIEKAEICILLIVQQCIQAKYHEAIETGRKALSLLGVSLPNKNNILQAVEYEIQNANKHLGGREIASLIEAREMKGEINKVVAKLLIALDPPVYIIGDINLYMYVSIKTVSLSLQHGNIAESAKAYSNYGLILGSGFGNYEDGYKFGMLAVELCKKLKAKDLECKANLLLGSWIQSWNQPLRFAKMYNLAGYYAGLESGEVQFASYNIFGLVCNLFIEGKNLLETDKQIENYMPFTFKVKNDLSTDTILGVRLIINHLTKKDNIVNRYGVEITEIEYVENCIACQSMLGLTNYYILKAQALFILRESNEALSFIENASQSLESVFGNTVSFEFNFYQSLIYLSIYNEVSKKKKKEYLGIVNDNQKQLKIWAENCPENFLHKYLIVKAEIARVKNKFYKAIDFFNRAIDLAETNDFIQDQAIANELLAELWLEKDKDIYSVNHLQKAYFLYESWGATYKLEMLKEIYPSTLSQISGIKDIASDTNEILVNKFSHSGVYKKDILDYQSILKSSQALSQEVALDNLLEKMLHILIENAGAERGVLIVNENNHLSIKAESQNEQSYNVDNLFNGEIAQKVPLTIINYVSRTKEGLILDDSPRYNTYANDEYIQTNAPKSVLCFPVFHKGDLRIIVYLENNLTYNAFNKKHLNVIETLASQAAISFENATLYEELKKEIEERKRMASELKEAKERWRSIAENSPDHIILMDLEYKIQYINYTVPSLTKEEVIGQSFYDFLPKDYHQVAKDCLVRILNTKQTDFFQTKFIDNNGKEFYFEVRVGPVIKNDKVTGFVSSSSDITSRNNQNSTNN